MGTSRILDKRTALNLAGGLMCRCSWSPNLNSHCSQELTKAYVPTGTHHASFSERAYELYALSASPRNTDKHIRMRSFRDRYRRRVVMVRCARNTWEGCNGNNGRSAQARMDALALAEQWEECSDSDVAPCNINNARRTSASHPNTWVRNFRPIRTTTNDDLTRAP